MDQDINFTLPFSVLISVYHKESADFLFEALNSIWNDQVLKPNEIVIVKDGPLTKDLDIVIEGFSKMAPVKIVPLLTNQGLGAALKIGLTHCSNEIVARMDSDDISKPNRFEVQLAILNKYPDIDVIGAAVDEFTTSTSDIISTRRLPKEGKDLFNFARKKNPINHPVVIFKKKAVLEVGSYLEFPLFEDYYLWGRMLMNGAKFYNCSESLLFFRFSKDTFLRRGGWKYSITELQLERAFFKLGLIRWIDLLTYLPLKFFIRNSPSIIREFIYKKMLR